MSGFLDQARKLLDAGVVEDARKDFERVFDAIRSLRDVFYKSSLDLNNIESVFSAFKMAHRIGKLGDYPEPDIAELDKSTEVLIVRTLDESLRYSYTRTDNITHPPAGYDRLVSLVEAVNQRVGGESTCSLLTFNYDIALDYALVHAGISHDYCLAPSTDRSVLKLLKLHGSLNWAMCPTCHRIKPVPVSMDTVLELANNSPISSFTLPAAAIIGESKCEECSSPLTAEPVIVPPIWNKITGPDQLAHVWKQAAVELGQAENIVCIGYSLPESDSFFKYLFALGTVGPGNLRRLWVFDKDCGNGVEQRYRKLIGKGIEGGFKFVGGDEGKFSNAVWKQNELWRTLTT